VNRNKINKKSELQICLFDEEASLKKIVISGEHKALEPEIVNDPHSNINEIANYIYGAYKHNPAMIYLSKQRKGTARSYKGALKTVAIILLGNTKPNIYEVAWHKIRKCHIEFIRARLQDMNLSPDSRCMKMTVLRGVISVCWEIGIMESDAMLECHNAAKGFKRNGKSAMRHISNKDTARLVKYFLRTNKPQGIMYAAVLSLLWHTGMRRSEIHNLDITNYDPASGKIMVLDSKWNKSRPVWVSGTAKDILDRYIKVRGNEDGRMWYRYDKGGNLIAKRIESGQAIYNHVSEVGKKLGIKVKPVDFRGTLCGNLLDNGVDICKVADIMGHSSVATTQKYDKRPEKYLEESMKSQNINLSMDLNA